MTQPQYPDVEGFAYSFSRGELTLAGRIFTAITSVQTDQPTEEGAVQGTRPYPLKTTVGTMAPGEGTVTFSDEEERQAFLTLLGDAYREKRWTLSWVLTAPGKPPIKKVCYGCRVLSDPDADEYGPDPLGGDILFSYLYQTKNGKVAHSGLPNPTG
jgi:hypothetical protein